MRVIILLLFASIGGAQCLDYQDTWIDWSKQPPAVPTSPRAMDVRTWESGGNEYLVVNHGNGLVRYRFAASGLPVAATMPVRFACPGKGCPVMIEGDYDQWMSRFSICDGCERGVMCSRSGCVIFHMPNFTAGRFVETSIDGVFTFRRGNDQYVIATGWPDMCGTGERYFYPAVMRLTGSSWELLQCLGSTTQSPGYPALSPLADLPVPLGAYQEEPVKSDSAGIRTVAAGLDLGSHVYLIDNWGQVCAYRADGAGAELRLELSGCPLRGLWRWGASIALDGTLFLNSLPAGAPDQSGLWDVSRPERPVFLSHLTDLQGRVALGDGFAAVFSLSRFEAFDVRDPSAPRLIAAGAVPDLPGPAPWAYPWQAHMGGAIRDSILYLADYSVGVSLTVDLEQCSDPGEIFDDGFESGDTAAWR